MPPSKAEMALVAERRAKLITLRRAGIRFEDPRILDLGYGSRGEATKDFKRAIEIRRDEQLAAASVYRQEENERLDALLEAIWPCATTPSPIFDKEGIRVGEAIDMKAVDTVLKLMDRRAKLMGLDMPVKAELSGPGGGAVPVGPVAIAELRALIQAAGDPDNDEEDNQLEDPDEPDDDNS